MAKKIEIQEHFSLEVKDVLADALSLYQDVKDAGRKTVLKAKIAATHSGRLTNNRVYPGKMVKQSVDSFMKPTPKPLLKHHNAESDPLGRIYEANFIQTRYGQDFDYDFISPKDDAGSGFIELGVNIMDQDAIEKVIDGRFKNVSTRQISDVMLCSICGNNLVDNDSCEHMPGQSYKDEDGKDSRLCFIITGKLEYKEVSLVSVPGDSHAEISTFTMDADSMKLNSFDLFKANVGSLVLTDGANSVNLLALPGKTKITAKDREKLTGKTIIAVGQNFNTSILDSITHKEQTMTETKTKEGTPASGASTAKTEVQKDDSKEGVVAPEKKTEESKVEAEGKLSEAATVIALEAVTSQLDKAKADAKEATAEIERLKAAMKEKDTEIDQLRKGSATIMGDMKAAYAHSLLTTQVLLKKPTVASITDKDSFDKKLTEYSGRSVESLKDSIKDLDPELVALKDTLGIKTTADLIKDNKIKNPVVNKPAENQDSKTDEPKDSKSVAKDYFGS